MEKQHGDTRQQLNLTFSKKLDEFNASPNKTKSHDELDTESYSSGDDCTETGLTNSSSCESLLEYGISETESFPEISKLVVDASLYGTMARFSKSLIDNGSQNASFLVTNLSPIIAQFRQWKNELPMVEPFYAVKCNPDPVILRLLASLGCCFDCATMGEIDTVLNSLGDDLSFGARGIAHSSIVYANPAKMEHMLTFAMENNVRMTVFDGEDELIKIAAMGGQDKFDLLLRLTTDDKASICRFSKKFGCPVEESEHLLQVAKSLGLHVKGVSFHVGSGCGDAAAYTTALAHALRVFETAERLGMPHMTMIDIGGGFPGDFGGYGGKGMPSFKDLAAAVRAGIKDFEKNFSRPISTVRFIAEPGRYFVSASTSIVTKIYARKGGKNQYQALYVDDGVYGSFNNVVYDHATPVPQKLSEITQLTFGEIEKEATIPTAVFGPTCDGLDQMCSLEATQLARCQVGDWLYWANMGAYTHTASFVFNGYTHVPQRIHCVI